MKEATLKEIAEQLGISITTVSKALKGYSDVSLKTKNAVISLAKELNYTPNSFAVNLRTKESKTIGLIVPEIVHHFFSNVINGIVAEAEKNGYLVIILQSNESLELEKKQVELLINKRVDGIIMSLSNDSNDDCHLKEIVERKIPFVQFDKIAKLIASSKVIINDQEASSNATQHLIDAGFKKIAYIRGPINPQNSIDRFIGFKKTIQANGLEYNPGLVYTCEQVTFKEGVDYAAAIINDHPDVDAIFCTTDLVAVGVLSYLNDHQITVPDMIGLMGFSNWFMSQVLTPKLSTVEQPSLEMGIIAFNLLLEEMNCHKDNLPFKPRTIVLKTEVIIRESTIKNK